MSSSSASASRSPRSDDSPPSSRTRSRSRGRQDSDARVVPARRSRSRSRSRARRRQSVQSRQTDRSQLNESGSSETDSQSKRSSVPPHPNHNELPAPPAGYQYHLLMQAKPNQYEEQPQVYAYSYFRGFMWHYFDRFIIIALLYTAAILGYFFGAKPAFYLILFSSPLILGLIIVMLWRDFRASMCYAWIQITHGLAEAVMLAGLVLFVTLTALVVYELQKLRVF